MKKLAKNFVTVPIWKSGECQIFLGKAAAPSCLMFGEESKELSLARPRQGP
jgi:hypothetical protein